MMTSQCNALTPLVFYVCRGEEAEFSQAYILSKLVPCYFVYFIGLAVHLLHV
jgi:hypothetical protein